MSGPLSLRRTTPVDPVRLLAEIQVRLLHAGVACGPRYNAACAIAAMTNLLSAMDIPAVPTESATRAARHLAGVRP